MIVSSVGIGGMGVVYAAYDPELDRKVALKLLRGDVIRNRNTARTRFVREAKAMARLTQPNVITVFDAGSDDDDDVFLAMEYVQGETLGSWVRRGQRPWQEVVDKFVKAGRGLAAAHDAMIIHRDFKPDNVLLDDTGRVLVTDFGLARAVDSGDDESADEGAANQAGAELTLTQTGAVLGTPAYMAPEQRLGLRPDARGDQFSFCVALYEALYGRRPFAGTSAQEIFSAIEAGELSAPLDAAKTPGRFRRILERGLKADPDERYASMHVLLAELEPSQKRRGGLL
ncbi:MAG: serine/threonine-protein kinase, partial [Myxococcota bacterium]